MRLRKKLFYAVLVLFVFYIFNFLLTVTYYNPTVAVRAYSALSRLNMAEPLLRFIEFGSGENDELYPLMPIKKIQANRFWGPRASVIGTVVDTEKISDGDWHINVKGDDGRVLVTEMAPEYQLPVPALGVRIKIWGVVRYDLDHRWWELHPIFGWETVK